MANEGAAATKRAVEQAEAYLQKTRAATKTTTAAKTDAEVERKFSDIQSNSFMKIIKSSMTPQQKKAAMAKLLTSDLKQTKDEHLARLKEYQLFQEYLQFKRTQMAQELLNLADTETFAQLKNVIDKLYGSVLEFDESLRPMREMLDAVYALRMAGKGEDGEDVIFGVYKEVKERIKAEEERKKAVAEEEIRIKEAARVKNQNTDDIAVLNQQHRLGFKVFGLKQSAKDDITRKQNEIAHAEKTAAAAEAELERLAAQQPPLSKYPAFQQSAEQLEKLLNISDEGHIANNKRLISSAQGIISNTSQEVSGVRVKLEAIDTQTEKLSDGCSRLQGIYALMTDAIKDAAVVNKQTSESLKVAAPDEDAIGKMKREDDLNMVNGYIKALDFSAANTVKTLGDLAEESVRVMSMKDMCQQQIAEVSEIATSGVASIASSMATVAIGVAQTAITESAATAKGTVTAVHDRTLALATQGAMANALGTGKLADEFNARAKSMEIVNTGLRKATEVNLNSLSRLKENTGKMLDAAKAIQESFKEATAAHADVDLQARDDSAPANDDGPKKRAASGSGGFDLGV